MARYRNRKLVSLKKMVHMNSFVKCIIWWLLLEALAISLNINYDNDNKLAKVLILITCKHLRNLTSTIVVAERTSMPDANNANGIVLKYFLQHLQEDVAVQLHIGTQNVQPWEYYVLIVDSFEAFRMMHQLFPENYHERHFRYLIVLTQLTNNLTDVMIGIFTLCYQLNVIDVNIILDHPKEQISLFTYKLFSENTCRSIQPYLYFKFSQDFEELRVLFPDKLTNFYGCPISVSGRELGPFLDLVGNKSDPKPVGVWENLSGLEGLLIREISKTLNFTLKLLPLPTERSYFENSTFYGSFLELKNGRADIAVGGFSGSDPSRRLFSPSVTYHSSPFVYVVRGRVLNALERLGKPFSFELWVLLVLVLIIGSIFILVLNLTRHSVHEFVFGEDNRAPLTNYFAVILGYPVCRNPRRNFARYIFMLMLLFTLIVRNAYQGSLYDAFRRDRFVRTPSGYDEIVKWNYKLLVSPEIAELDIYSKHLATVIPVGGYQNRIMMLQKIRGKYASPVLRESYLHFMEKSNWRYTELSMVNEVVFMYHFVMFFQKHSILVDPINKKLKAFGYSGITNTLKLNLTTEAVLLSMAKAQPPKEALTNRRLQAMYWIYVLMKIISVVVFGLELASIRIRKLERLFRLMS